MSDYYENNAQELLIKHLKDLTSNFFFKKLASDFLESERFHLKGIPSFFIEQTKEYISFSVPIKAYLKIDDEDLIFCKIAYEVLKSIPYYKLVYSHDMNPQVDTWYDEEKIDIKVYIRTDLLKNGRYP